MSPVVTERVCHSPSASTARMIADAFRGATMDAWPHVDGVVALTHTSGCGMVPTSEGGQLLRRTLRGYATHPNVAGVLVLKDGKVAYETYQYGNTPKTRWMSMSVAKSVTSTLYGAAIKDEEVVTVTALEDAELVLVDAA